MSIPTKPVEGQKTGTSGLRKKVWIPPPPFYFVLKNSFFFCRLIMGFQVKVFQEENYLANWIQVVFMYGKKLL